MDEHQKFLADRLLSEQRSITYRLLSRALDVHVNTAKGMLYDFYQYQNAQRPDSVHATYLIFGVKHSKPRQGDNDVGLTSSMPEPDPFSDDIPTSTLTLVSEGNLRDALSTYQEVTAIHIYSLAPHSISDRSSLTDAVKSISEYPQEKDPATAAQKFGIVLNPNLRKRTRDGRPETLAPAAQKPIKAESVQKLAPTNPSPPKATQDPPSKLKKEPSDAAPKNPTPSSSSSKKSVSTSKRGGPGGIMQSFAKAASRPPSKPKTAPEKDDDSAMALSDDGEADDADIIASKETSTDAAAVRRTRKEREEELKRMMEEDEEEDEDEEKDGSNEQSDEEMQDAVDPDTQTVAEPPAQDKPEDKEPAEVVSSTGDGRRRGKRRIMKKKRILDDQGYMVTIQEPGWESFSEDEVAQPPAKKAAPTPTPSSSNPKAKKPTGKSGQGNIMSFFSKK
ncbi:CDC27 protein [Purpureocillium takamizusanense]|uniref:DNA polymerase delta subunit 3 n=1 Tax=Purpureocillium takamizusanense TaxID=2060973 RepID=A0A9Q8QKD0_9HYPO|nr:CDC27 protein [Purpureocillium takamizusanense]UNI20399.1 CDC27 protein [Purpureocillium takamizusanense]